MQTALEQRMHPPLSPVTAISLPTTPPRVPGDSVTSPDSAASSLSFFEALQHSQQDYQDARDTIRLLSHKLRHSLGVTPASPSAFATTTIPS